METPWTNASIVGVHGTPLYQGRKTALAKETVNQFANKMRALNLKYTYDYVLAVMK
jgi:hypothetical protein